MFPWNMLRERIYLSFLSNSLELYMYESIEQMLDVYLEFSIEDAWRCLFLRWFLPKIWATD